MPQIVRLAKAGDVTVELVKYPVGIYLEVWVLEDDRCATHPVYSESFTNVALIADRLAADKIGAPRDPETSDVEFLLAAADALDEYTGEYKAQGVDGNSGDRLRRLAEKLEAAAGEPGVVASHTTCTAFGPPAPRSDGTAACTNCGFGLDAHKLLTALPWEEPDSHYGDDGPHYAKEIEFVIAGARMRVSATDMIAPSTMRTRYKVECLTCEAVLHRGTTGATDRCTSHLKDDHGWAGPEEQT